jgi:hypothetical protein
MEKKKKNRTLSGLFVAAIAIKSSVESASLAVTTSEFHSLYK